jgi:hypothetical protein
MRAEKRMRRSQEDTHLILVFMHILGRVPSRGVTGCSDQAGTALECYALRKIGGGGSVVVGVWRGKGNVCSGGGSLMLSDPKRGGG